MPTQPKTRANDASVDAFLLASAGTDRLVQASVDSLAGQKVTS